jgi:geranylgeranyl diphosphate synthase type I
VTDPDGFLHAVHHRIGQVIADSRTAYAGQDPELDGVLAAVGVLTSNSGKGTRAHAVHLGWRAAGGEDGAPTAVNVAAAFELLHLSALVHDDLIDGSAERRGRPTVHVDAASRHGSAGLTGDRERFSAGVAVLVGNLLWSLADHALGTVNETARAEWNAVRTEVNLGQYLDLVVSAQGSDDPSRIDTLMNLKTAKYTFERPLRTGAAAADPANTGLLEALGGFGHLVGRAFQIRDDILGVFGDSSVTGKPTGNDLREGKATVLLARSAGLAANVTSGVYARVGSSGLTDSEIETMRSTMVNDGTLEWAEHETAVCVESALADTGWMPSRVREDLVALARSAADRVR